MSDNSDLPRLNKILSFLPPMRIVTFFSLLALSPWFRFPSDFATQIFYCFFLFFVGSFIAEWVLIAKLKRFRQEFWPLYSKYVSALPFEFLGVFIFVMYSFRTDTSHVDWNEVKYALTVFVGGMISEILHRYVYPRIKTKKITNVWELGVQEILSIICLVVLSVFTGIYGVVMATHG